MNSLGLNVRTNMRNEIVELPFRSLARADAAPARYFVNSKPDADRTVLLLGRKRASKGETLHLENPRRYVIRQFVSDFKTHKPENLKNVDLDFDKNHITMYVDGKRVMLRGPQLAAY